ncbi:MAG: hypothetical protein QGD90_04835 [Candidatus Hydrogenedentes bacterium]|nr:hypothetical protein [Candidatus Hydrogenedentota bacterium]
MATMIALLSVGPNGITAISASVSRIAQYHFMSRSLGRGLWAFYGAPMGGAEAAAAEQAQSEGDAGGLMKEWARPPRWSQLRTGHAHGEDC